MSTEGRLVRVLIADDHAPTRADVRRALDADERFEICADTADAAGAVQAAVRERPDICLLDVSMPGGGLSAAWEIAARLPRTKVVMLTVSSEDADLFAAIRAGAEGYLLKTMNFTELPDELPRVFRTGNLRLFHAASCPFRYSSRTSCGVRYPSVEWRRVLL